MAVSRSSGFTLVEVLVALAVVAIALAAGSRAAALSTDAAAAVKMRVLADCVAENRMSELAMRRSWPAIGAYEGGETQGGIEFVWRAEVLATPHPGFRRVEIRVATASEPARELRRVAGVVAREN